ncbi:efflux RND transporter permease subunit [Ochrobactrum teleogrylli]|uniref:Efflux RND transporter permease subunit n=1 Tax=Ochrobactrum soli TaxID=2448455 RepID=A0A849KEQ7_9HYPH|nr:efflux RND transporter permease subunit [[Ochrobactrum] soli]NNU60075.1 efflux RND transporter permease subunit [[Ochrobactrum] soli]
MSIWEMCVRRPVFATVLSLVLVLLGIVSYERLSTREYPDVEEPTVSVSTTYSGANAEIVESQVTQVLETQLSGIAGIDVVSSTSRAETSAITVRFTLGTDPEVAAAEVRDRVSRARRNLPDEIDEPIVAKVEADAQPIMYVAFTSDRHSGLEITDVLNRTVVDRIQNLPGVSEARILGAREYAMRVWIDARKLAGYGLTVQDVETALENQNVEVPAGRIESKYREFTLLANTALTTPEEFANIIINVVNGYPVRLRDIGRAELGAADERQATFKEGETAVSIGVVKQATANPLDVANAVRAVLPTIQESLPTGMRADVTYDTSIFIDRSIEAVFTTIGEAIVLVIMVIFFFLRSVRASLIPIVTIPVSLITTLAIMFAFGFSINTLTLLAMVLAIGLVVDDAIVVLENVHRRIEEGETPVQAAIAGTGEIAFAVIAMTLTLAAVYVPIAFTEGRTGQLFIEFALTLAGAVLVSGFVALTLTPMMCGKLLRHNENQGRISRALEGFLDRLNENYRRALGLAMRHKLIVLIGAASTAALAGFLYISLPSELAPIEDRGVVRIAGTAPEGSTLQFTQRYGKEAEAIIAKIPEISTYFSVYGFPQVTGMSVFGLLEDWGDRERSQQEIVREANAQASAIPGLRAFAFNMPSLTTSRGSGAGANNPVQFVIQSSSSYEDLNQLATDFVERIKENPGLINVESNLDLNKPRMEINMNREKIREAGLQVSDVGRTLETMFGSRQVTRIDRDGEQSDVLVQLDASDRATPDSINVVNMRGSSGQLIPLSNLVTVTESVEPANLYRFNRLRSATISAGLAPDYSLGEALTYLQNTANETFPTYAQYDLEGESRDFTSSNSSILFVFGLAILFIYLVLAAQFESFVSPFIILLTVPLSIAGALLALWFAGASMNVYSQIGLVTLVGLITKHGILIVEFANHMRDQGRDAAEAVVEAAVMRLRPILMTTGAMVLGAIPLAIATGAGAQSRQAIGWVIVGGMSFGTLLTLFVVPVVYTLVMGRAKYSQEIPSRA